jgi:hypothetical protein
MLCTVLSDGDACRFTSSDAPILLIYPPCLHCNLEDSLTFIVADLRVAMSIGDSRGNRVLLRGPNLHPSARMICR